MHSNAIGTPAASTAGLAFPLSSYEPAAPGSRDIAVDDLAIRCLRKPYEIREVAQLRRQIDLAAAASADPQFATREKKETNWVWSSPSSCMIS